MIPTNVENGQLRVALAPLPGTPPPPPNPEGTPEQEPCRTCENTGTIHDGAPWEEYNPITCPDCDGKGYIFRNYLAEAFRIVQGQSGMDPEPKHLAAVLEYCRQLSTAALALPKPKEVA